MILLKLLPLILKIQNKILTIIYRKQFDFAAIKPTSRTKTYFTANSTLQLNSAVQLDSQKVNEAAKQIVKKYINNPENLLKFIQSKGTLVIKADHIDKILTLIGEGEGFLTPCNGLKALILTTAINILSTEKVKIGFSAPEMFIMRNLSPSIFLLAHQFRHWLAFKKGLPGYDTNTMKKFKDAWSMDNEYLEKMSINDILSVKDAIARDLEAIDFVKEISREFIGSKSSVEKLKTGQSINI